MYRQTDRALRRVSTAIQIRTGDGGKGFENIMLRWGFPLMRCMIRRLTKHP
jgi:hypothetical protein